jgi:hypothetical protein
MGSMCQRCRKSRGAFGRCGCADQQRAWSRQRKPKDQGVNLTSGGHQVAIVANRSVKWCSCGYMIREGRCVAKSCGKVAPS